MIHPIRRNISPKTQANTAGNTKEMRSSPIQSKVPGVMAAAPLAKAFPLGASQPVHTQICPTSPPVPIPADTGSPLIYTWKRQVANGPVTAEARVGGIQIRGFFTILGI